MPQILDAALVRAWCALSLDALGRAREEIDAINVYPVADGDTGTNLYLTLESAAQAVEAAFAGHEPELPSAAQAARAMAHGALIGARGNSGTILAQLLRGMAEVLAAEDARDTADEPVGPARAAGDARALRRALRRAAESAYEAVAHPVEGTVLTVATAAADGAAGAADDCRSVVRAAYRSARTALEATPRQLAVLGRAGVVDAGGRGLVAVLGALVEACTGERPAPALPGPSGAAGSPGPVGSAEQMAPVGSVESVESVEECEDGVGGPAYEVIYLLEATDPAVERLRARLDGLGDSLVVVGGDGLWNVHVHVDDAGAAVEAGVEAGRPYRIRITHFGAGDAHTARGGDARPVREPAQRAIVAVVPGEGLAGLYGEAGATTVLARPGEPPASGELVQAIRRAHAREVVLLPNDADLRHTAAAAAEQARTEGVRVALIPTRSAVQGIAALAVHEPGRRFDEDVVSMTSAMRRDPVRRTGRRRAAVLDHRGHLPGRGRARADRRRRGGDRGDPGPDATDTLVETAVTVLDRMLAAGGEMVTLVLGDEVPDRVADLLERHVRDAHLAVDTVVYRGGRHAALLLVGVE